MHMSLYYFAGRRQHGLAITSKKGILWNHGPWALGIHIIAPGIILRVQRLALTKPHFPFKVLCIQNHLLCPDFVLFL